MDVGDRLVQSVIRPVTREVTMPVEGKSDFSWSSYWSTLISATVETAAPTHVVLTFPAPASVTTADFTMPGFTFTSLSWTGNVLTLVSSVGVSFYEGNLTITFVPSGGTATVTNNVASTGTKAWYQYDDLSTITKDESEVITQINEKLATGINLVSVTGYEPVWSADGIVHHLSRMTCANFGNTAQPTMYYILLKFVSMPQQAALFQALNQLVRNANNSNLVPSLVVGLPGGYLSNPISVSLDTWHIIKVKFNGGSSWAQVDNEEKVTFDSGTLSSSQPLGFGWRTGGTENDMIWREWICRSIDESDDNVNAISAYLEKKK